jgi:lambda repressor-like predicted transcriptional regulator
LVGVEQWAELRREHFVGGVSIKELSRRTGLSRNTVRARCVVDAAEVLNDGY